MSLEFHHIFIFGGFYLVSFCILSYISFHSYLDSVDRKTHTLC